MRRLLIGMGYVGGRVAEAWRYRGDGVTVLTRDGGKAERLRGEGYEAVVGDVTNGGLRIEGEFDSAVYCVGFDRSSGADKRAVSVGGPENVLRATAGRVGRWVFTSTTGVYGQTDGGWVDEGSPTDGGEIAVEAESAMRSGDAPTSVLRLAGIYGPGRLLSRPGVLEGTVPLPGRGEQWLNLIHGDDAAAACVAASEGEWPETVLVCDNEPVRRADYYGRLASLRGLAGPAFDGRPREGRGSSDKRSDNRRLRSLRFAHRFPTYREGLAQALSD